MPGYDIHQESYRIAGNVFPVEWQSYDFSDSVASLPDEYIRTVMLDSGVMYVAAADPKIRVSHLLDLDLQGLSAAHEELCMTQRVDKCSTVEQMVINSIANQELQRKYIGVRLRMFGTLCMLDTTNQSFAQSRSILEERAAATS